MSNLPAIATPTLTQSIEVIPPHGRMPDPSPTLSDLIRAYSTDPDSNYCKPDKLTFATRQNYAGLMARIERDFGALRLADIDLRQVLRMHEAWLGAGNHVPMAHGLIGMLRTLMTFGAAFLRNAHCRELKTVLRDHRFQMGKARKETLTADMALQIIRQAHKMGLPSIALAQALQTSGMLRQKDIIGETLPASETKGIVQADGTRWHKGATWDEVDDDLILRHVTSKKGKPIVLDLKKAPFVMEELRWLAANRDIPRSGPMVIYEKTGLPFRNYQFRREWRIIARVVGIPDHIFNMDTRAAEISTAIKRGAKLQDVRKAATHATEQMTQRYSRMDEEATDTVLEIRAEYHAELLASE